MQYYIIDEATEGSCAELSVVTRMYPNRSRSVQPIALREMTLIVK